MRYFPLIVTHAAVLAGGLLLLSQSSARPEFYAVSERCNGLYSRGEIRMRGHSYPVSVEFRAPEGGFRSMYEEDVRSYVNRLFGISDGDMHFSNCGKPSKKKAAKGTRAA